VYGGLKTQDCRGKRGTVKHAAVGKRGTEKRGTKLQDWKTREKNGKKWRVWKSKWCTSHV